MLEILTVVIALALDQASKALAASLLPGLPGGSYPLWPGVFHFTYAQNRGAAFSFLSGQRWLLLAVTTLACGLLIWTLIKWRKELHPLLRFSLALILAGALGNLIDRAVLGYVRDMLDFTLINFAIFNVADSAVCVGGFLLCLDLLFLKKGKALVQRLEEYEKAQKDKKRSNPADGQGGGRA